VVLSNARRTGNYRNHHPDSTKAGRGAIPARRGDGDGGPEERVARLRVLALAGAPRL